MPANLPKEDMVFLCTRMVPQGLVSKVEYIVYVDPEVYFQLSTQHDFIEVARLIGRLNKILEGRNFILIGPGRWGSTDYMQGVSVTYADIFNTRALIELASKKGGYSSEPSYGTHFFQDLIETHIYPLAIHAEEAGDHLNLDFIKQASDHMPELIPKPSPSSHCIKVIQIPVERPDQYLEIVMDGLRGMGYLARGK